MATSELMPGGIAAIKTFGDRINLHPHLNFLVTEGGRDKECFFRKIPRIDYPRLAKPFGRSTKILMRPYLAFRSQ